jgi:hypothetical protein
MDARAGSGQVLHLQAAIARARARQTERSGELLRLRPAPPTPLRRSSQAVRLLVARPRH